MVDKIKTELGSVQETLLLPLWGRAFESQKKDPRMMDRKAIEIIDRIDYDFSTIAKNISWITQYAWVARSLHVDHAIREFIRNRPRATIVNIGCGLDTTFERIDNGRIRFYDLDLPDVIDLRKKFFRDNERRRTISCSFLDTGWMLQLLIGDGVMVVAAGVFYYFTENQIKNFFLSLADRFPGSELFFDSASPLGVRVSNRKVIRDGGMNENATLKWGIENVKSIENWDRRMRVLQAFPMFRGMKRGFPIKTKYGLWMSDLLKIMSMVHLRMEA